MEKQSLTMEQMRRAVSGSLHAAGVDRGVLVLAAVSGGMDSVCLLHILCTLAKKDGFYVAAAHVEHGIRGAAAQRDAAFVQSFAQSLDVPFLLRSVDAPKYARDNDLSVEDAARRLRYAALGDMARQENAACIVTAHHADDQAETALMGLVRGSAAMMRGMRVVTDDARGRIVRPMLSLCRADVARYVEQNRLFFVTDETNADVSLLRNRIRRDVIPLIAQTCNPSFVKSTGTLLRQLQRDEDFLQNMAQPFFTRHVLVGDDRAQLDETLFSLDEALFCRVAVQALLQLGVSPSAAAADALFALGKKQVGRMAHIGADVRAVRVKGGVTLQRASARYEQCVALDVPGCTHTPWGDFCLTGPMPCADPITEKNRQWVVLNASDTLFARPMQKGERMRPLGLGGSRLVSDVLCDAGFDRMARENMCLVATQDAVVWIPFVRADERARVKKGQVAYLIEFAAR